MSKNGIAALCLWKKTDRIPSFDIRHSLFDIRYSFFRQFLFDQTGCFFSRKLRLIRPWPVTLHYISPKWSNEYATIQARQPHWLMKVRKVNKIIQYQYDTGFHVDFLTGNGFHGCRSWYFHCAIKIMHPEGIRGGAYIFFDPGLPATWNWNQIIIRYVLQLQMASF